MRALYAIVSGLAAQTAVLAAHNHHWSVTGFAVYICVAAALFSVHTALQDTRA